MTDEFDSLFSKSLEIPKQEVKEEVKEQIKCKCNRNTFTGIVSQRRSFSECSNFQPFYHIAAMNNWKEVVKEQKDICDQLNLKPICGILGSNKDAEWTRSIGLNIQYHSKNIHEYETPTLKMLYDWSKNNPDGRVLYFHTKGVSAPEIIGKKYWRWIMNEQILINYKDNLKRLDIADILGISWMHSNFAHFAGNFWMARCDWINILKDPIDHQKINGPIVAGNPWKRMSAELWLGSKPYHIADSLCGENLCMYCEDLDLYDKYRNI
jgi:hypothetical protein